MSFADICDPDLNTVLSSCGNNLPGVELKTGHGVVILNGFKDATHSQIPDLDPNEHEISQLAQRDVHVWSYLNCHWQYGFRRIADSSLEQYGPIMFCVPGQCALEHGIS